MTIRRARYGWKRDLPDQRDIKFIPEAVELPPHVDWTSVSTLVYNQGQLGSCTANAIGGAIEFAECKENYQWRFTPSRLFIYYNERVIEGTVGADAGAEIRDGIKSVVSQGVCPESSWPYDISTFTDKPDPSCYQDAKMYHTVKSYLSVSQDLTAMKTCLAQGFPFVYGFTVYQSFESDQVASTGVVPMPAMNEQTVGGHAVLAVGYDDATQRFITRNSWGTGWGQRGYFTIPYEYLTNANLAADFWTVRLV